MNTLGRVMACRIVLAVCACNVDKTRSSQMQQLVIEPEVHLDL